MKMKKIFTLILNKFNLRRSNLFKNPILIYTMGKVGSSMIERQLPNAYHCHTLYGNPPCPPYLIFKFGKVINFIRKLAVYPLKRIILRNRKKLKIVTLYRDPLTRNPSMMFQDLHFWIADYLLSKPNFNRESNSTMLLDIFKKVAQAIDYAHRAKVMNCDLKLENILVKFNSTDMAITELCVADFGLAIDLNDQNLKKIERGSLPYMAPELFLKS